MQLPVFLENLIARLLSLPRVALIVAVPAALFLMTVAFVLATSGDGDSPELAVNPTTGPSLENIDQPASPTATATRTPVPTPEPANRADCAAIQGTAYESPEEREWYLANCLDGSTANIDTDASTDTGTGGGAQASQAPAGGGGHVSGAEYAIGARLIIPAIGVDAVVTGMDVGASGAMPDPVGYFNAVMYNFPFHPGLGAPNIVLAGHVDCAYCYNGSSGLAVFGGVSSLPIGATAQFVNPDGSVSNYVVVNSYAVGANSDFTGIVAGGSADMTIITCTGTFSGGHYDSRHVVAFQKQG